MSSDLLLAWFSPAVTLALIVAVLCCIGGIAVGVFFRRRFYELAPPEEHDELSAQDAAAGDPNER